MRLKVILWKYEPRKDGTCNIKIYASIDGKKKYFKTKLATFPRDFDDSKGEVKKSHPSYKLYNATIRSQIRELEDHLLEGGNIQDIGRDKVNEIIPFLQQFIADTAAGMTGISMTTIKNYKSLLTRLQEYSIARSVGLTFESIDLDFYDDFKSFLFEDGKCGMAGFGKHIKVLKALMSLAMDKGLHNNTIFRHKLFKKVTVKTNKIYLTKEEIKQIEDLDLSEEPSLDRERDRFLTSYYFLTRYSDSVKIRKKDFFEKSGRFYLRYFQVKTDRECVVPAREAALSVLEKRDYDLSGDTNQEANRKLKTICAMAEINTLVQEGNRSGPKWKFVTTHTARRSAATHLALQGVNLKIIADLGGWENVETLRTYLRSSGLDSAEVAKDLEFFQ